MSDQYNAEVVAKSYVTDSLFFIKIKPDSGMIDFVPGQYIALGLTGDASRCDSLPAEEVAQEAGKLIRRSYSIGSAPGAEDGYEFYIALLPQGVLTARLAALEPGSRVFIGKKPIGKFTLADVPEGHPLVLVATGTGIAPYVSMLREGAVLKTAPQVTLLHGVRYASDFGYGEELQAMAAAHDNFTFKQIVSRESEGWEGARGYVQDFIVDGTVPVAPDTHHLMLCGNPNMIEDLEKLLVDKGFIIHSRKTPGNVHVEKYW